MKLVIILMAILVPTSVSLVFSIMESSKVKISKKMTDENFTVMIPNIVIMIGALAAFMSCTVMLCFTFFSDEVPHPIFYVTCGLLLWVGVYLIIKTLTFKVIVEGDKITVFSAFRKPYSFTFSEIVSAVRQVKNNQKKSERIVIKTSGGKRVIVENAEINYKRFAKRIQTEVNKERLDGFK